MTLQWIPLDQLVPHPENSNRMPAHLLEKLKRHIQRTGLYEPLVVRPIELGTRNPEPGTEDGKRGTRNPEPGTDSEATSRHGAASSAFRVPSSPLIAPRSAFRVPGCRYQILNGHHRAEVLRQLGHTHARCDVWPVSDDEARLLLATLNRLEGRDDPGARAHLVARLAQARPAADLAQLLPEPADAVARLLKLAAPPPAPLAPEAAAPALRPMMFFLTVALDDLVSEALREINKRGARNPEPGATDETTTPSGAPSSEFRVPSSPRASALERLALWYLEARNLR